MELPVPGYPPSEEAVTNWFQQTYGRPPSEQETGAILDAMARREASKPLEATAVDQDGWKTGSLAPPATRR